MAIFLKQYIYKKRCRNEYLSLQNFQDELELQHKLEYSLAKDKCTLDKHVKQWSPIVSFDCEPGLDEM